tara:strand:+ start:1544 stop:1672 length:129 start_codon:yes stop_codon:yes gene_type:complete
LLVVEVVEHLLILPLSGLVVLVVVEEYLSIQVTPSLQIQHVK